MEERLKSIALRTSKLCETKDFFQNELGFEILEFSYEHFVLYMREIRIVFIHSDNKNLEIEVYIDKISRSLTNIKDPNGIKIMECFD